MVALRQFEHQFGFERPFDMEVQLGLGQRRDERGARLARGEIVRRSEEHTSELQSLMRISYAVFCLKKQTHTRDKHTTTINTLNIEPQSAKRTINQTQEY